MIDSYTPTETDRIYARGSRQWEKFNRRQVKELRFILKHSAYLDAIMRNSPLKLSVKLRTAVYERKKQPHINISPKLTFALTLNWKLCRKLTAGHLMKNQQLLMLSAFKLSSSTSRKYTEMKKKHIDYTGGIIKHESSHEYYTQHKSEHGTINLFTLWTQTFFCC